MKPTEPEHGSTNQLVIANRTELPATGSTVEWGRGPESNVL